MSEETYLTAEGADRLRVELEQLKGPVREEMGQRLRAAIEMGDLSENAEYHSAKEAQGFLEGRIQELEYLLQKAIIVEESSRPYDSVEVGARVTIQEENELPETYHMVGAKEADPRKGRISNESPIGKALLGKRVGDQVNVNTPAGSIYLKILKIE